jgi:glucose/arabinose dehydrogenase
MSALTPWLRLVAAAVIAAPGGIFGCGGTDRAPGAAGSADTAAAATTSPAVDTVTVPAGFRATVFADTIGQARQLTTRPNGDVYVNTWRSPYDSARRVPSGGFLVALRDTNKDGKADQIERFGSKTGNGGTGIAFFKDALYAEAGPTILRYRLKPDELAPGAAPDTIVSGLPIEGGHPMHPFTIDPDGNLFVNSGSSTNSCQVKDRQPGSPGQRPCKELATRAGIWRFSATTTGQRFAPGARYATGIRNAGGLAINPADGALYASQHGRDQLAENWPKLYDWKQSAELPAEELLQVVKGGDYGWPYCYYDPAKEKLVQAPEYGGDGEKVGECADKLGPVADFPAHWAPNALTFYSGEAFPETYRGGAFIGFHGSWNRAPEPQQGYNVVFQPFSKGKPSGEYQIFADGFAGPRKEPGTARHRPSGLAVGPDGALYISDDSGGRVWRVVHGPPAP